MTTRERKATERHYAEQGAVGVALVSKVKPRFDSIDPENLSDSIGQFTKIVLPLVQQHARASRGLATRYYADMRRYADVSDDFRPELVGLPDFDHVQAVVKWATDKLWSDKGGPGTTGEQLAAALTKTAGGLQKATLDVGRNQIIDAVQQDRKARAWAREARPDACWFCKMLAGRVYAKIEDAGGGDEDNRYHDHCHCQVVPVFGKYEAPAHVREWAAIWERPEVKNVGGMRAKQRAFRQALEGREIKFRR